MKKIKKTLNWLKKHLTSLVVFMISLILILLIILIFSVIAPAANTSEYGDRLDGINEILLKDKKINSIEKDILSNKIIEKVNISLSGKIINIKIELNEKNTIEEGKNFSDEIIKKFNEEEKNYYDFQIFLTNTKDKKYTIIGYKTPKYDSLSWSNN